MLSPKKPVVWLKLLETGSLPGWNEEHAQKRVHTEMR
jgi:hypothetical protein